MRRRTLLVGATGTATLWALAAGAQDPRKRLIGFLSATPEGDPAGPRLNSLLLDGLAAEGWIIDRDFTEEVRRPGGDLELLRRDADELVAMHPDVLVGATTPPTLALMRATSTIPIVFCNVSDPVGSGFVDSFAHPGRNITGCSNFEESLAGKWLDLLLRVAPGTTRVGMMFNPKTAPGAGSFYLDPFEAGARARGVEALPLSLNGPEEIDEAVAGLAAVPHSALVAQSDIFVFNNRERIAAAAAVHRLPAIYPFTESAAAGGLMAYAVDLDANYLRAGQLVARILAGANPAELPVLGPTNFLLTLNLAAARAQGISIPPDLLATATRVIE